MRASNPYMIVPYERAAFVLFDIMQGEFIEATEHPANTTYVLELPVVASKLLAEIGEYTDADLPLQGGRGCQRPCTPEPGRVLDGERTSKRLWPLV